MALLERYFFVEHFRFWFVSPKWPGHLSRVEESSKSYQNNHKKWKTSFLNIFVGIWWWEKSPTFLPHMVSAGPAPLLTASLDRTARLWRTPEDHVLAHPAEVNSAKFNKKVMQRPGRNQQKNVGEIFVSKWRLLFVHNRKMKCYSLLVYLIPKLVLCKESPWMSHWWTDISARVVWCFLQVFNQSEFEWVVSTQI